MHRVWRLARSAPVTALALATGCDPVFTTQYRQALAPAPAPACVETALRASPRAAVVWRDTADRPRGAAASYIVTVRDSLTPGGTWRARVVQGGVGDSAWVWAGYSYISYAAPPPAVRARRAGQAAELLDTVRVRCGPAAPRDVRCRSVGGLGGQRGACAPAA